MSKVKLKHTSRSKKTKKGKSPKRSKLSRLLRISNSKIKQDYFADYTNSINTIKVESFLNHVSNEIHEFRSSTFYFYPNKADKSPKLSPEGDFTNAVSFTSADGKNERVFYFKEGHVPSDQVLFSESKGTARIPECGAESESRTSLDNEIVEHWGENRSSKLNEESTNPKFVFHRYVPLSSSLTWDFKNISDLFLDKLTFSLQNKLNRNNRVKSQQEEKLLNILFSERSRKRILKRILFGRFPQQTFLKRKFTRVVSHINLILSPTLFYTYPDEDHRAFFSKWPQPLHLT